MRKSQGKEGDLVRAVIAYLTARGAFAWRNNSGMLRGVHKGKPWAVRMGVRGMPDVCGVVLQCPIHWRSCPGGACSYSVGRLVAVECKRLGNRPTEVQERTMEELRKRGALVIVAYSISDVERALA